MDYLGLVRDYYRNIDANNIDAALSLFADDAVYLRENRRLTGIKNITIFYKECRAIRSGKHCLDEAFVLDDKVCVLGRFEGVAWSGKSIRLGFSDSFRFNTEGKVSFRCSAFDY